MGLQTATNPDTGERVVLVGDQWKPFTETATNDKGVKAYLTGDKWLTDESPAAGSLVSQIPTERGANLALTPQAPVSLIDKIYGAAEVLPAMAGGMIGGVVTPIAQLGHELLGGQAFTPQGKAAAAEFGKKVQSQFYQLRTEQGQDYTAAIGNALAPMIGVPIPTLNALGQSAPAAARAIRDVGRSEANLIGGAIAAPLEARAARIQEGRVAQSYANAPIIDAAKAAERQGFAVDPAITNPTMGNRAKGMVVGPAFNEAALPYNAAKATEVARKDLGVASTENLTPATVDRALDVAGKPYDVIRKMGVLQTPQASLDALSSLKTPALIGGEQSAAAVSVLIDDAITKLQQGRNGALLLDDIRSNRRNANAAYKAESVNPDPLLKAKADAQMSIANILEDIVDANAPNPKALSEMRAARQRMAQIYDHDRAINYANKTVDPQVYAKLLDEKKGNMTGVGADIGIVAAKFPDVMSTQAPKAQAMPTATRSGILGAVGALAGGAVAGYPGALGGAALGGATGIIGNRLAARGMVNPAYQTSRAIPTDYRPGPNMLRPVEPRMTPNGLVPYDYSQQIFTQDQMPNFVMRPGEQGPLTTPGVAPGPAQIGMSQGPVGGQMGALRMEDARLRNLSMQQGAAAEAQQAAAAAASRQPTGRGSVLEFDPITGTYKVGGEGVKGATPDILESTGKTAITAAEKARAGQFFNMSAEEKIQWGKSVLEGMPVTPGETVFRRLTTNQILDKISSRQGAIDFIKKAREEAQAFNELASRQKNAQARREILIKREQMLDMLADLEDSLRPARPVSSGIQGSKTREFNRNQMIANTKNQNAMTQ